MFFKKTGFPEEGEILLCTVTNIQYSMVFVKIDEYDMSGMIHISEIAAGRIRNIRDYVKEGKKVVCKVLRINEDRGHVDLSLRRVSESQRRNKVNEIKLEQKAESIIEYIAKQNNIDFKKLFDKVSKVVLDEYGYLHHAFEDAVDDQFDLKTIGLDKKMTDELHDLVVQRFKAKVIEKNATIEISTYNPDGVELIKSALIKASEFEGADIKYLGGGKYRLNVSSTDYKVAENNLKKSSDMILKELKDKAVVTIKAK